MASAASNPNPYSIGQLLGKLTDNDPDFRFMSLNDLNQILCSQKSDFLKQDYNTSSRIVDAVVKSLDDQNGEVQNLAVKCITPLAAKVQAAVLSTMFEKLTSIKITNSPDNSLPALALRNAIEALPKPVKGVTPSPEVLAAYSSMSHVLFPRLLGLSKSPHPQEGSHGNWEPNSELTADVIDVFIVSVRCFGPLMQAIEVEKLQDVVFQTLEKEKTPSATKKRAVVALAILAPYLSEDVLNNLIRKIQSALSGSQIGLVTRRLYINIMGSLARSIPHQFGEHLPQLVQQVLTALSQEELDAQMEAISDGDDQVSLEFSEVREASLVTLEAFLASCGPQMRPFTEDTIAACLRYLKFDPNYAMDDDDEDMDEEDEDEEDEDDEDDFDDDGGLDDDDDDASWKVRRCAAKTLYTLISTRSTELLEQGTLYSQVAPPLVKKFDEREESVRLEVIATMGLLIRKTGEGLIRLDSDDEELLQSLPESRKRRRQSSGGVALTSKAPHLGAAGVNSPTREEIPKSGPRADLSDMTPNIIKATAKLLKGKQIATKQATISLLDDLIAVQHGGLSEYFDTVLPPIIDVIKGVTGATASMSTTLSGGAASATAITLRVAALHFMSDIAKTHSSALFQNYLSTIIEGVVTAAKDRFYKISSEAIRTAEELIKAITPPRSRLASQKFQPEWSKLPTLIMESTAASDADTEVRQKAIQALGTLISRTLSADGQALVGPTERQEGLKLLLDRLKNETTRLFAVRAIDNIAAHASEAGMLDQEWADAVALELCGFLRKANRALRGASIQALQHLILSPATQGSLSAATVDGIMEAVLPAITANDSYILAPGLLVLSQLQRQDANLISTPHLIEGVCEILKKNISGSALQALISLVVSVGESGMGKTLMGAVLQVGVAGDPAVTGKVAGALFVASNGSAGVQVDSFVAELKSASKLSIPDTARQSLALAILGEIGLRLGEQSPLSPQLFLDQFNDEPDKVSVSAAVALGRAGAGNVSSFLPVILGEMKKGGQQYLLLQSIREILQQVVSSSKNVTSYQEEIWKILFSASQSEDNKAVCAECIGRLTIIDPKTYIPRLQELLKHETAGFRAIAVQAIRYTLPDSDESFDSMLKIVLFNMILTVLQDEDMEIRRLGMTMLNSATHNKPDLISTHLGQLMPYIMAESVPKPELMREVQMGPFKHQVDDGLEARKSAYETLYSLMEMAFSRISSPEFYDRIIAGLNDDNDIRSLCNLMLSKLIVIDPDEITRRLDTIAECYRRTLSKKLKDDAVKQEVEKQNEAQKSILRVSILLAEKTKSSVPSNTATNVGQASQNPVWQQYWEWVNKEFTGHLRALRDESREMTGQN